jgi:putative hydrolase of the HAD superfamily
MQVLGIDDLFCQVFTIEDTWRPKPDGGTLEFLFAAIGRRPDACLFVGDRYDIDLRLPSEMGAQIYQVAGLADLLRLPVMLGMSNTTINAEQDQLTVVEERHHGDAD